MTLRLTFAVTFGALHHGVQLERRDHALERRGRVHDVDLAVVHLRAWRDAQADAAALVVHHGEHKEVERRDRAVNVQLARHRRPLLELEQLEHKIATLAAPAAPSSKVAVPETGLPPMGGPTSESESDESVMPYDEAGMRVVAARIARDVDAQLDVEMVDAAPSGAEEPQPMSVDDELEELEKKEAELAAKRQALLEKKKVAQECAGVFRRNP